MRCQDSYPDSSCGDCRERIRGSAGVTLRCQDSYPGSSLSSFEAPPLDIYRQQPFLGTCVGTSAGKQPTLGPAGQPVDAAVAGVAIHGLAGELAGDDLSEYSVVAGDLVEYLPEVFKGLSPATTQGVIG